MISIPKEFFNPSSLLVNVLFKGSTNFNYVLDSIRFHTACTFHKLRKGDLFSDGDITWLVSNDFYTRTEFVDHIIKMIKVFSCFDKDKFSHRFGVELMSWTYKNQYIVSKQGLFISKERLCIRSGEKVYDLL